MKVLLIGAGRMGLRHLQGLDGIAGQVHVVDPKPASRAAACATAARSVVSAYPDVDAVPPGLGFDAAIVASTAAGRVEIFDRILERRVPAILLEKPLDQSRTRARAIIERAQSAGSDVWVNHYRRTLVGFEPLLGRGPFVVSVSSGAMGLGVNGIHWIDFMLHLTGADSGRLLFGEIDEMPIASGRGAEFRDYGGRGLLAFSDGSRLMLSCLAMSSAPTTMSIVGANQHWLVDQHTDRAWRHARAETADHPTYLYGKDYGTEALEGLEAVDLPALTAQWVRAVREGREPPQPRVSEVRVAYDLLFDLLETSSKTEFDFT